MIDWTGIRQLAGLTVDVLVKWPLLALTSHARRKGWVR